MKTSTIFKKAILFLFVVISALNGYAQLENKKASKAGSNEVLPVTLTSFTTKSEVANKIIVNWSTASEANNSHFEILISEDGHNFVKVGQVKGVGNSSIRNDYQFVIGNVSSIVLNGTLPLLIFLLIPSVRNRKLQISFFVLFALSVMSCSKKEIEEELFKEKKYYVNLRQIDNDGTTYFYDTFIQRVIVKIPKP